MSNARAASPGPRPSGNHRHGGDRGTEVPSITSAPEPLEEDQARRTHRYLLQMGIRVICFLGAIAVGDTWVRWVLVVAAVVLPYSAVLFANAGRDRVTYDTSPMVDVAPTALPAPDPGPGPHDQEHPEKSGPATSGPETYDGPHRVVEHQDDPADENRGGDR
ncbi:DUF3099 domain-containing protein [Krasilnikoviella flava]|uniref:DUF3099 domain-containing protein n=1 Tax=Krasilnikoviella flava TaxID=526729 RepID=A0A1T5M2Y5_9MICO|nr:DUF3099 domain-containing protein [Krasilnikoviella flava]SKC82523.1 Protein of unknown function [Krasilnikoviella flava]